MVKNKKNINDANLDKLVDTLFSDKAVINDENVEKYLTILYENYKLCSKRVYTNYIWIVIVFVITLSMSKESKLEIYIFNVIKLKADEPSFVAIFCPIIACILLCKLIIYAVGTNVYTKVIERIITKTMPNLVETKLNTLLLPVSLISIKNLVYEEDSINNILKYFLIVIGLISAVLMVFESYYIVYEVHVNLNKLDRFYLMSSISLVMVYYTGTIYQNLVKKIA